MFDIFQRKQQIKNRQQTTDTIRLSPYNKTRKQAKYLKEPNQSTENETNSNEPNQSGINENNAEPAKDLGKKILKRIFITLIGITLIVTASTSGFLVYLQHFAKTPAQPSKASVQYSKLPAQSSEIPAQSSEIPDQSSKIPAQSSKIPDQSSKIPAQSSEHKTIITIHPGERFSHIATMLETSAIITNRYLFIILAGHKGAIRKIQAGEYELSGTYSPEIILEILVKGKVKLHRLTIPEGLNIRETATIVEKAGFGKSESFIQLATDMDFIETLGIQTESGSGIEAESESGSGVETESGFQGIKITSLEGYLFPETYFFPAGTAQKKIIKTMVERFRKVFIPEWKKSAEQLGFSTHQIVTLASIIEKETGNSNERPLIASVFHNRLQRGMRLESDPTVIYGIPDFNGNITKKDLLAVTPYNTYMIYGLPAGPIANPGKLALKAAIFPLNSDFIFFVSRKDTTHQFSKTLKEHNLAVRKYQLNSHGRINSHGRN
ncbi:MAG: endolytic transglycosylase MltG [Desulfamplus sp.]|nr:endolytic transglycosylase MltG [Desulfamplus sp.]